MGGRHRPRRLAVPPHLQPGDPEPEVRSRPGAYIRRWVPELAGLDDKAIHAPWEVPPLDLQVAGVTLGDDYPEPLVDHAEARTRALAAYAAVGDAKASASRAAPRNSITPRPTVAPRPRRRRGAAGRGRAARSSAPIRTPRPARRRPAAPSGG